MGKLAEKILLRLVRNWPSPVADREEALGNVQDREEYLLKYAFQKQFDKKVRYGAQHPIRNKKILELGCGQGGISCFLALNGARQVVGIDLSVEGIELAHKLLRGISDQFGQDYTLPVDFKVMDASKLEFENNSIDIIWAENFFEHCMQLEDVLIGCKNVLVDGGRIIVPSMPSIYSKYGLHLKNGLKMPWANLIFSEKTICNVLGRMAENNPKLLEYYPGIKESPKKVRDLRRYKDLNGITYKHFIKEVKKAGLQVTSFRIRSYPFLIGNVIRRIPFLNRTLLLDIFSTTGEYVISKPKSSANQS